MKADAESPEASCDTWCFLEYQVPLIIVLARERMVRPLTLGPTEVAVFGMGFFLSHFVFGQPSPFGE